jgi:hypothetical protein
MKPISAVIVAAVVMMVGCGGGREQTPPATESGPAASTPTTSTTSQPVDITFESKPDPPKMGENSFEATVMANGQPVTDADVVVELFMAAMPSMNMSEMRSSVPLKHEGGGRYRGTGNVMMSGAWDATVSVKRGGQEIGNRKFSITAK